MKIAILVEILSVFALFYICGIVIGAVELADSNIQTYSLATEAGTQVIDPKPFLQVGTALDIISFAIVIGYLIFFIQLWATSRDPNFNHTSNQCATASEILLIFLASIRGMVFFIASLIIEAETHFVYGIYSLFGGASILLFLVISLIYFLGLLIYDAIKHCFYCCIDSVDNAKSHAKHNVTVV